MANVGESFEALIEIKIRTDDSQTYHLSISNQRSIRNLKEDIALMIGIPIEQQHLLYCGEVLQDDQVISSYNVQHGDVLHLVCTMAGMSSNGSSSSRPGASHSTGTDGVMMPVLTRLIDIQYDFYLAGLQQNNLVPTSSSIFYDDLPEYVFPNEQSSVDIRQQNNTELTDVYGASHSIGTDGILTGTQQDVEGDLHQNLDIQYDFYLAGLRQNNFVPTSSIIFNDDLPEHVFPNEQASADIRQQNNTELTDVHGASHSTGTDGISPGTQHNNFVPTSSIIFYDDLPEYVFPNEQASADIRQQNNTELTNVHGEENNITPLSPSQDDFTPNGDIHVEETATARATTENVTENMGTGVSSRPSTVEYNSAHESSTEPSDEHNLDFSSTR